MKKNIIFSAIALLMGALTACNNTPSFNVQGKITEASDKMLYFEQTGIENITALDSVKLNDTGEFHFKQESPNAPDFYRLRIDNKIINFAVDSTENIEINANLANFSTGYDIKGSDNNTRIKELVLLQAELQARINQWEKSGMPIGIFQDSLTNAINAYKNTVKRNYIFAMPYVTSSYFALFQEVNGFMIFEPLVDKEDLKCFAAVATSMNNRYPHADRSRNLYNMVIKGMKNARQTETQPLDIPENKIQEAGLIDVPLKDIEGKTHHLTDLKGKVVVLEFTAYQSATSGAHNLALREIYNKYAPKGLEVYQVSLDTDEHFWKTAADNLPWICVRDPQGPYSSFATIYGLTELPTAFLINRENELCVRIDKNSNLEQEIKKLL